MIDKYLRKIKNNKEYIMDLEEYFAVKVKTDFEAVERNPTDRHRRYFTICLSTIYNLMMIDKYGEIREVDNSEDWNKIRENKYGGFIDRLVLTVAKRSDDYNAYISLRGNYWGEITVGQSCSFKKVTDYPSQKKINKIRVEMEYLRDLYLSKYLRLTDELLLPSHSDHLVINGNFPNVTISIPLNFNYYKILSESVTRRRRKIFENKTDFLNNYDSVRNRAARIIQNAWLEAKVNPYCRLGYNTINRQYDEYFNK